MLLYRVLNMAVIFFLNFSFIFSRIICYLYLAMENFGLAIYLEKNFLLQPNITTKASEQLIVKIISHEISHQVSIMNIYL